MAVGIVKEGCMSNINICNIIRELKAKGIQENGIIVDAIFIFNSPIGMMKTKYDNIPTGTTSLTRVLGIKTVLLDEDELRN